MHHDNHRAGPTLGSGNDPSDSAKPESERPSPLTQGHDSIRKFQRTTQGMHTLIVEDMNIDQKIALGVTTQLGMRSEVVDSGMAAIEKLRAADAEDPFDLVLLDYKLPNLDGLTACKHIKKEVPLRHPPNILLLSAYRQNDIFHVHSDRSMVDGFIAKPVSLHFLGTTVAKLYDQATEEGRVWPYNRRNDDQILAHARVLLAEDNAINQRVAIGILSRKGVKVTIAQNGQEAIDKVLSSPPETYDIVLMDVDMPVIDGYDATRRIRSTREYSNLPIIALTAHNSARDKRLCFEAGMSEFLTKPIKPNFLYQTLLSFLR